MALRVLEAKKSKYYDAALGNLAKARKLLLKEGQDQDWAALAGEIRAGHSRKTSFVSRLDRLSEREPTFLERARKRWREGS